MFSANSLSERKLLDYIDSLKFPEKEGIDGQSNENPVEEVARLSESVIERSDSSAARLSLSSTVNKGPSVYNANKFSESLSSEIRVMPLYKKILYRDRFVLTDKFHSILPVTLGDPLNVGDFLLWPDIKNSCVFYTLVSPRTLDFSVTIRPEEKTGRIPGGSLSFTVSVYAEESLDNMALYRQSWSEKLEQNGYGRSDWKFQPLNLRNLVGQVTLAQGHQVGEAKIVTSNDAGIATFLIELSEAGILAFKAALEKNRPDMLQGICQLTANYLAQIGSDLVVKSQILSVPLGTLASGFGSNVILTINPQVSADIRLHVVGDPLIESVIVDLKPSEGMPPQNLVFGPEGGEYIYTVTSDHINSIYIDWNAKVNYKPDGWPIVIDGGKLSFSGSNNVIIKPSSWVRTYSIFTVLLDSKGNTITASDNANDLSNRAHVELAFKASYIEGKAPLISSFETNSQQIIQVPFSLPPGEFPEEIKLSIISTRTEEGNTRNDITARTLKPEETMVVVKIYSDSKIEIMTNEDPLGEDTFESEALSQIAMLT